MPYINAEDILAARQIDLLSYLQTHEPGELVKLPGNNYCTREHDSLKISNGKDNEYPINPTLIPQG